MKLFWLELVLEAAAIVASLVGVSSGQVMRPELAARCRAVMPHVYDDEVQAALNDPQTLLYTEAEMRSCFQLRYHVVVDSTSRVNALTDPGIDRRGNGPGNGNREFPWLFPGGTDNAKGVYAFRFVSLPKQASGKPWPIVVLDREVILSDGAERGDRSVVGTTQWLFPVGTVIGEVFTMRAPSGRDFAYEVRARKRFIDDWQAEVFRPYPTADDLAAALERLGGQGEAIAKLRAPLSGATATLVDRQPLKRVFHETAARDDMPSLPAATVEQLLTGVEFKPCSFTPWKTGNVDCHAPCAPKDGSFSIVPTGYQGCMIPVSHESCARCHETALRSVDVFAPNLAVTGSPGAREWYGRIRGSDGIFSFHPFAPQAVEMQGYALRQSLVDAGIVAQFDRSKHPADRYKSIPRYSPPLVKR